MQIVNSNVDNNGIPYRGFIKADKLRARWAQNITGSGSASLNAELPELELEPAPVRPPLLSDKALMIVSSLFLVLAVIIAYQLIENRQLAVEPKQMKIEDIGSGQGSERAGLGSNKIVVLEKSQVATNTGQSDTALYSGLRQELSGVTLYDQANLAENQGQTILDYQSMPVVDPLPGYAGLGKVDPQIARMRERTARMINFQSSR